MGTTYATTVSFGSVIPDKAIEAFNAKQADLEEAGEDYYEDITDFFWEAASASKYPLLEIEQSGNYNWDERDYAVTFKGKSKTVYDLTFVRGLDSLALYEDEYDDFVIQLNSFFLDVLAIDPVQPEWLVGTTVG
jgi:hypothetical protein